MALTNKQMIPDASAITIVNIENPNFSSSSQSIRSISEPYSIFSTNTKILIVVTVSISGFFSPFSTNIYFPALSMIEKVSVWYIIMVSLV